MLFAIFSDYIHSRDRKERYWPLLTASAHSRRLKARGQGVSCTPGEKESGGTEDSNAGKQGGAAGATWLAMLCAVVCSARMDITGACPPRCGKIGVKPNRPSPIPA